MADLDFDDALQCASQLTTIGHPFSTAAINATAMDLVSLCKGVIRDGRAISPAMQASQLVTAARMGWEEGWPDRGGTHKLKRLCQELFDPAPEAFKPWEAPKPPDCEKCGDTGWESFERRGYTLAKLCTGCGGKRSPAPSNPTKQESA